jgi:dTDP-4-dehydrorhamnose 3,5-epimerase
MSRFAVHPTGLAGALVLERQPIADARGFLERLYCDTELADLLAGRAIRQVNRTLTRAKGTVRGMHFQRAPHGEMKLVHCLAGAVFDVAVDLRQGSPTFGRWHGLELAGDAYRTFVIPEGFAHGFQTLTDDCEMLYLHTAAYRADAEAAVSPLDPLLSIRWPVEITEMSERDRSHPAINDSFEAYRV